MTESVVIDTNVPVVANGKSPQASRRCELACISKLREVVNKGRVVIDDRQLILDEYRSHFSFSGQPGVGDEFFLWLWDNQAVEEKCERVPLTPIPQDEFLFSEFPHVAELRRFDPDDKKFVAVALASANNPMVLNAVDSDWWDFSQALTENGVRVRNLCGESPAAY